MIPKFFLFIGFSFFCLQLNGMEASFKNYTFNNISPYLNHASLFNIGLLTGSSTSQKSIQIIHEITDQPIVDAVFRLSDPMRHGVMFSFLSDVTGEVHFNIKKAQQYFICIEKEGFLKLEMKLSSEKLASLKKITLAADLAIKKVNFVSLNSQLRNENVNLIPSQIDMSRWWLHPEKQVERQEAGYSHKHLWALQTSPPLSY